MTNQIGPCASVPTAQLRQEVCDKLQAIIAKWRGKPGALLPLLQEAQTILGHIPLAMQKVIAADLNMASSHLFGTMSFYTMFAWQPRGENIIRVCQSPPCHVAGGTRVLTILEEELGIQAGGTTPDRLFTLEPASCLGASEVAPAMQINDVVFGNLTRDKIRQIISDYREGKAPACRSLPYSTKDIRQFRQGCAEPVLFDNVGHIDPLNLAEYVNRQGYAALKKAVTDMTPEEVIEEVKTSGLRGRGGAGFPTGLKLAYTRGAAGDPKYIVCNADEGEPGTCKDRYLMEGDPHKILEGMAIAGYAVGASQGFIYVRGEYHLAQLRLGHAIGQAEAKGLLGERLCGTDFSFHIQIRSGFGAYICGEETALIESLEGRRGFPRLKPPYPGTAGLWGKPTVVNNVETLANLPAIIRRGGSWYKSLGTPDTPGTKIYQVIGQVASPQVLEAPVGITLRELIQNCAGGLREGRSFKMCQTGGSSAGLVTAEGLDAPLDFGSIANLGGSLGSGSMLVMDDSTCVVDFLKSVARFFEHESCGQCTPCREGTQWILEILTNISQGKGRLRDLPFLEKLVATMQEASFCPLGQSAPTALLSALKHFRPEIETHIKTKTCAAGVCLLNKAGGA